MALYLGVGGGGDVIMAATLARGEDVGHVPWERRSVDPEPGPVPPEAVRGAIKVCDGLYAVMPGSYAERGGRRFETQGACVARVLNRPVYAVDPYRRPSEVARALLKFGKVVGVDVGGDVLGAGCEDTLRSPLADAYSLAVLARVEDLGGSAELVVMSPGADGELPLDYALRRAAEIARRGGYLGSVGLVRDQIALLERLAKHCVTEASSIAVRAARGEYGVVKIRGGSRSVEVSLIATVGFVFDPRAALAANAAARIIYEEDLPVDKAADLLISLGIPTELHAEMLASRGVPPERAAEVLMVFKSCDKLMRRWGLANTSIHADGRAAS